MVTKLGGLTAMYGNRFTPARILRDHAGSGGNLR